MGRVKPRLLFCRFLEQTRAIPARALGRMPLGCCLLRGQLSVFFPNTRIVWKFGGRAASAGSLDPSFGVEFLLVSYGRSYAEIRAGDQRPPQNDRALLAGGT